MAAVRFRDEVPSLDRVVELYRSVRWSSAGKPDLLYAALCSSHTVMSAWDGRQLVGLASAISDGHLVVYYPHLLVHPEWQRRGIGQALMRRMMDRYEGFHQQVLLADRKAVRFYERLGFTRAESTEPMWVFDGIEPSA